MSSRVNLPDGQGVTMVGTTSSKFADNFPLATDNVFNPSKWLTIRNTGGITLAGNVNGLVASVPTTNGAELLVVGRVRATIPANLLALVTASARVVNTKVRVGYVEVDPATGVPIDNTSVPGDFANSVRMAWLTAVATEMSIEATSDHSTVRAVAQTGTQSIVSSIEASLEVRPEDVVMAGAAFNALTTRSGVQRMSIMLPDPNKVYVPFIWIVNTAVSTAATYTFRRVLSMDIQEVQAEIGGGRGNSAASMAIPVVPVVAGPTQPVSGSINATITQATASASSSGATNHKLLSGASTNATSVKASAGKVVGGIITNSSASWRYLKFYNKASAPTVGTDVPVLTIGLPPGGQVNLANIFDMYGLSFTTGIAYAITGLPADADTTAIVANEVIVAMLFI